MMRLRRSMASFTWGIWSTTAGSVRARREQASPRISSCRSTAERRIFSSMYWARLHPATISGAAAIAAKASNSSLGTLSVIDHGAALVHRLQKIGVADVAGVHQVHRAAQQLLQCLGQIDPAPRQRTRRLLVQFDQEVVVAGLCLEVGAGCRAKELQMRHAIALA